MTPYPTIQILQGDCLEKLGTLPDGSIHCCVTSPPYWGLRDYGIDGQLGLEKTPEEYVSKMVAVFREVKRVLRDDGTLWLNLGDSYAAGGRGGGMDGKRGEKQRSNQGALLGPKRAPDGLKSKDLVGIPWMVAFALRADGWYLRSDIIWHKPNPMPESVTDRPTKSHEYIFMMSKSERYFYDSEAIKEPQSQGTFERYGSNGNIPSRKKLGGSDRANDSFLSSTKSAILESGRNKRSVWSIPVAPYSEAHFATYPPDLIKPCIMAGTSAKGCCPQCGAPWERIVNVVPSVSKDCPKTLEAHIARGGTGTPVGTVGKSGSGRINGYSETLGWEPSCDCGYGTLQPCTILDPFAGSGTTGEVAIELGRNAILIELNPEYVRLIEQRTNVTPGMALV